MTVKLAASTFLAPVTYSVPGDDSQVIDIKFRARFNRLSTSAREMLDDRLQMTWLNRMVKMSKTPEIRALFEERVKDMKPNVTPISDVEICQQVLAGWELQDVDGESVPFGPDAMAEMFEQWYGLDGAIAVAYVNAVSPKVAEKNSVEPSSTTSE